MNRLLISLLVGGGYAPNQPSYLQRFWDAQKGGEFPAAKLPQALTSVWWLWRLHGFWIFFASKKMEPLSRKPQKHMGEISVIIQIQMFLFHTYFLKQFIY